METEHLPYLTSEYKFQKMTPLVTEIIYTAPDYTGVLEDQLFGSIGVSNIMSEKGYFQVSDMHGRSICRSSVWGEEEPYFIDSLKGAKLEDILHVPLTNPDSPSQALLDLYPKGLSEITSYSDIEQYINASRIIRNAGLPTEYPIRIHNLTGVTIGNQTRGINELLISHAAKKQQWIRALPFFQNIRHPEVLDRVLDQMMKKMEATKVIIVERKLPVAERLCDLLTVETEEQLFHRLLPAMQWVRAVNKRTVGGFYDNYRNLSFPEITKLQGLEEYFLHWLPSMQGRYLRSFHELKLGHRSAHEQNWMTIGALADTEGVRGESVGFSLKEEDIQKDIDETMHSLLCYKASSFVSSLNKNSVKIAQENFIDAYSS